MKRSLLATAVAAALFASFGAPSARADLLDDIMKAKKIRIATDLAIPPSGMIDSNLKPTGSDVETAQLLAQDWGLELEFVQTTGATRIPNVQTGKADIIRRPEVPRRQGLGRPEGQDHRRVPRHDAGYRTHQHEGSGPAPGALR